MFMAEVCLTFGMSGEILKKTFKEQIWIPLQNTLLQRQELLPPVTWVLPQMLFIIAKEKNLCLVLNILEHWRTYARLTVKPAKQESLRQWRAAHCMMFAMLLLMKRETACL